MADRSSAAIFGELFDWVAEAKTTKLRLTPEAVAVKLWEMGAHYDFSWCQMESDPSLMVLGLAKEVPEPENVGGTKTVYHGDEGFEAATDASDEPCGRDWARAAEPLHDDLEKMMSGASDSSSPKEKG